MKTFLIIFFLITSLSYPKTYDEQFLKIMKVTLKFEGGYFKEEETNFGIMQGTYNAYRLSKKLPIRNIKEITKDEVYDCYDIRYYSKAGCDTLGLYTSMVFFDTVVNFGISGGSNLYNQISDTLNTDFERALRLCDLRIERRYDIVKRKPSKKKFLKGWLKRDNRLKSIILQWREEIQKV